MKLKARPMDIQSGGRKAAILAEETASSLGVLSSDRVRISYKNECLAAIVNTASDFPRSSVGLYKEVSEELKVKTGDIVEVEFVEAPESLGYVHAKIAGERLRETEIRAIVRDVLEHRLSDVELAAFLTALYIHGIGIDEIEALSKAMVETGQVLSFDRYPILDKHSIGGIPGDKASILVVPIVAAAGFIIPKTSSRAITSPAGTADRVEAICPVDLAAEEIEEVVRKTNGCMVWGGALDLAPADDLFIQVEYPLAIDPLLLPSIMSKKKAIGATHVVIDMPTGRGSKMKTTAEARGIAYDFIDLGKRLGIEVQCAITFGEQPLGYAIGPALEAKEALCTLMGKGPSDLREKATSLAGILLEMVGIKDGKRKAETLLKSGKAERKLREIVEAQGGDSEIDPEEIKLGDKQAELASDVDGRVLWLNNKSFAQIAREAGAPKEKGAGVVLRAKLGDYVKKGSPLFKIYAERTTKLRAALEMAGDLQPIGLSARGEESILMDRIPVRVPRREIFILER